MTLLGNDEPPTKIQANIKAVLRLFAPHLVDVALPSRTTANEVERTANMNGPVSIASLIRQTKSD
jgi:hypothetical protein